MAPDPDVVQNARGREKRKKREGHGGMEYAFRLARTSVFHGGGVGRSIIYEKPGYDTDARGVEVNLTLE